jgi:hypothetical protein
MSRALLSPNQEAVAANGLLDRRLFLRGGAGAALAIGGIVPPNVAASREPLRVEPWMKVPGSPFVGYGQPSRFEDKVVRVAAKPSRRARIWAASRHPKKSYPGTSASVRTAQGCRPAAGRPSRAKPSTSQSASPVTARREPASRMMRWSAGSGRSWAIKRRSRQRGASGLTPRRFSTTRGARCRSTNRSL